MNNNPILQILSNRTQIKKGQALDFIVRLRAPMAPKTKPLKRPRLNVSICIDASGSMSGKPLSDAKQAAQAFFDRLDNDDKISLVGYGSNVRVWLETARVGDVKEQFRSNLHSLADGGMTALHAGWLAAANTLAPFATGDCLSRVILLSDGQANQGIVDINRIEEDAQRLNDAGISTSSYGLGSSFDENLMTRIAVGGNAFYASSADELLPYFENEFNLLSQTVATGIRLMVNVKDADGQKVPYSLLNLVQQKADKISMSTLLYGSDSWVGFEIKKEAVVKGPLSIEASVDWSSVTDKKTHHAAEVLEVSISSRAGKINPEVQARCDEARASRLQAEAAKAASMGDIVGATRALHTMEAFASGNAYVAGVFNNLQATLNSGDLGGFSKEARYSSSTMSNRVSAQGEDHTVLNEDPFGLRKAIQGKASTKSDSDKKA